MSSLDEYWLAVEVAAEKETDKWSAGLKALLDDLLRQMRENAP